MNSRDNGWEMHEIMLVRGETGQKEVSSLEEDKESRTRSLPQVGGSEHIRVGRRKEVLVRKEYEFCHQIHQGS